MTSPQQHPAPDPDPRDEADEQATLGEEIPAPDEEQLVEGPQTDADVPDAPLPLAPDDAAIPESDRAPGVLRETPVGGKLPLETPDPAPQDAADPPVRDMPPPQDLTAAQPEQEMPPAPEQEPLPQSLDAAESAPAPEATEPAVEESASAEAPVVETPAETVPAETEVAPAPAEPLAETPASEDDTPAAGTTRPVEPPAPAPAEYEAAPSPESVARAQDWDEDISPELAAILFGGAGAAAAEKEAGAPAPTAETPAAPAPEEAAPAPSATPAETPAPRGEAAPRPRGPIMVTTSDEARSQPITTSQFSSPPPDAPVKGKMRYIRVEEPLRAEKGRRIEEKWEYFGPDYPALEGRLVKRVESEELSYADGSWKLTFRRDYSQGRDERTVRISSDGEYTERTDRIRRPDATTGKTVRELESVALTYAAPVQEEKRGFLAGLFKRGNGPQAEGAKRWRKASDSEQRSRRDHAGEAFKRGLFERS